jgi:TonB family protein
MGRGANCKRIVLTIFVAALVSASAHGADLHSSENQKNEADAMASRLLEKFTDADKKGVAIVDLQPAFGQPGSFGFWFADQLSASLGRRGQNVEVIDRQLLGKAAESGHLSTGDESDVKNAIALGKSVGAITVVVGSYGAAEKGLGVTLVAFRVSEYNSGSPKSMICMLFGSVQLTTEVTAQLGVSLNSLRPKDGVYRSGYGGVTVPICIKCTAPAPRVPDVDLQGMIRAHPQGATVRLQFVVTEDGHTQNIAVLDPVGFGFDEQFAKAALDWQFKPATNVDNKPVAVTYTFQTSFKFK